MPFKIPKVRQTSPFSAASARHTNQLAEILNRGLVVDSEDITAQRLADGRVRLSLRNRVAAAAAASAPTPPPVPGPGSVGTFTEFYCQSGGSNLNAGSTNGNAAIYSSTNGNYSQTTHIFTPTDGTNPVASGVAVGQFASIYNDGATLGVFVARITAVVNAVNGAITISLAVSAGAEPTTSVTARSIKIGGAFKGPGAAIGYPFTLFNFGRLQDVAGDMTRLNLKNDATYSITAQISQATPTNPVAFQGYSATPGDGGKAIIDAGASTIISLTTAGSGCLYSDLVFSSSAATGSNDLVQTSANSIWYRCIFHGARGRAILLSALGIMQECEIYDCNKSNTAGFGAFSNGAAGSLFIRCYTHNHSGSNAHGFLSSAGATLIECVFDTCGGDGINCAGFNGGLAVKNCDFYSITGNAIVFQSGASAYLIHIENTNFLKCGRAINNPSTYGNGYEFNCGYGSGTMANTNPNILGHIFEQSPFTYASNQTPWNAPTTGDFTATGTAVGAGRGVFTETGSGKTGTLGTPNLGAA